ncbi:MAG: 4Fe-4S dicluster domain-containing protein [Gemmatimonadetes bacterium]|nr:4Fe-4S dicluster domain-containing protein [Gemmatimonadota bacterium]
MTAQPFAGLDPCVHCGFCLQSCPTFLVTGDESDSPRGRIVLMRSLARGELDAADQGLVVHLDRCLGCRGCEPVCPSGVSYGPALEEARRLIATRRPVPFSARLTASVLAEPALREPLMALARAVRPLAARVAGGSRIGFLAGMLAATRAEGLERPQGEPRPEGPQGPQKTGGALRSFATPPAAAAPAPAAALFRGCIMDGLFGHVHQATERTLRANGYRVVDVPNQGCCGALHAHAGLHDQAVALARANVAAFGQAPEAAIVVNSAGCGAMLKEYPRLLAGDAAVTEAIAAWTARVVDVTEALASAGPRRGAPLPLTVAYDPPCHLLHAQRVADAPLKILDAIPGLRRVAHGEADLCCGSAGSYSLTEPALSRAVLNRKVAALANGRLDAVATGNPGCVMQIGAGLRAAGRDIPVLHPVELLDRSYALAGYYGP